MIFRVGPKSTSWEPQFNRGDQESFWLLTFIWAKRGNKILPTSRLMMWPATFVSCSTINWSCGSPCLILPYRFRVWVYHLIVWDPKKIDLYLICGRINVGFDSVNIDVTSSMGGCFLKKSCPSTQQIVE